MHKHKLIDYVEWLCRMLFSEIEWASEGQKLLAWLETPPALGSETYHIFCFWNTVILIVFFLGIFSLHYSFTSFLFMHLLILWPQLEH